MDVEFHYYMTYLIAARAGFGADDAQVIAYSSQFVDDNNAKLEINKTDEGDPDYYSNYISQTMNILKPKGTLLRIYPLFHFIPGDPMAPSAQRRDGTMHLLNTTPNSKNAGKVMQAALDSQNLYRIGIAAHGYVDTWAHQNFVGYYDGFNSMKGLLEAASPDIGHADAGHKPDWASLTWTDERLLGKLREVDNRTRFMQAAHHLFFKLKKYVDPKAKQETLDTEADALIDDLRDIIADQDPHNKRRNTRIAKYKQLGENAAYVGATLARYDEDLWIEETIEVDVRGLKDRSLPFDWTPLPDRYTWKSIDTYKQSHWYLFQEAVKEQQDETWDILSETTFKHMDLESL